MADVNQNNNQNVQVPNVKAETDPKELLWANLAPVSSFDDIGRKAHDLGMSRITGKVLRRLMRDNVPAYDGLANRFFFRKPKDKDLLFFLLSKIGSGRGAGGARVADDASNDAILESMKSKLASMKSSTVLDAAKDLANTIGK